jgi:DNA topoisomerase-1
MPAAEDLTTCKDFFREEGTWYLGDQEVTGEELDRLKKMGLPPAWTDVIASSDPASKIQAIGMDAAGRWQYRYSAEHIAQAAQEKFDRLKSFANDVPGIRQAYSSGMSKDDPRAWLLYIEDQTAIRVGSTKDFKAAQKAYGLTTLQNEHVTVNGDTVLFDFIAKEGKAAHYELTDEGVAKFIQTRLDRTVAGEMLFPDVTASTLNRYLKEVSGADYSIKDFRTFHATRIAFEELKNYAGVELSSKEKKKVVKGHYRRTLKWQRDGMEIPPVMQQRHDAGKSSQALKVELKELFIDTQPLLLTECIGCCLLSEAP